jgi:ankyrin repeat protein
MKSLPPLSKAAKDYEKTVNLTGVKDTDLLILQRLNDTDLLQAYLVNKAINKACKDESFWRNRSVEKFPLPSKYKPEKETWRRFYLKFIHYTNEYKNHGHLLRQACFIGDLSLVVHALDKNEKNVNTEGDLPLLLANQGSFYEIIKYLILHGANVNVENSTVLHWNCAHGNLDIVQFLVEHGANINSRNSLAIRWAATKNKTNILKYLLDNDANIHAHNDGPLRRYASRGDLEMVKYLIGRGAVVTPESNVFRWAVEKGHLNVVKYLTERDLNIDGSPDTLVLAAVQSGKLDLVKYLVQNGYSVTQEAIAEARTKGYTDIVDFFKKI